MSYLTLVLQTSEAKKEVQGNPYNEGEHKRFFVRFPNPEFEEEFKQTFEDLRKCRGGEYMELKQFEDRSYMVRSPGVMTLSDISPWGILFRKYYSMANDTVLDRISGRFYYPVEFSSQRLGGRKIRWA